MNQNAKIHIKVDTGMGRIGYRDINEAVPEILKISKLPHIEIEGILPILQERTKQKQHRLMCN